MGRLFWKFFLFFMAVQLATVVGVAVSIWFRHGDDLMQPEARLHAAAGRSLDAATVALELGGMPALRTLIERWSREPGPTVYAVDAAGRDLLDRAVPKIPDVAPEADRSTASSPARRIVLADGRSYLLIADEGEYEVSTRPVAPRFPAEPIVFAVLASLAVATWLAWYVSKPIRSLREAFNAAARGDLDVLIGGNMGRRRDELADLGHDFDRTAARLKLLMDGQRRLLHDVSHELRSPLARLQAAVGLARQQPCNVDASMDRIERESVRMDRLIDELLILSRVEAGMGSRHEDNVDLAELVTEVVQDASFELDAQSARVTFEVDLDAVGNTNIRGDAEMLHRALENVVRNAARHTPSGGKVQIVAKFDRARRAIQLTIADEGPGVPPQELEGIFEPFFRGEGERGTTGHGLGLAIARSVVKAHGGSIRASNRASGGLAVEIIVPA